MNKKTLEQKIKDIIFYAIIFCALYLIIGFLIKSQWLTSFSESWNYSYELIRDALTLTAYFLAPTAAFVLFSDWREQHTEVKIEAEAERIVKTILQINTDIDSVDIDIRNNFNKIHNQDYVNKINDLRSILISLNTDMAVIFDGVEKAMDFNACASDLIYEMLNYLNLMRIATESRIKTAENKSDEVKQFYKDKEVLYLKKSFERFTRYSELLSKIGISIQALKVN